MRKMRSTPKSQKIQPYKDVGAAKTIGLIVLDVLGKENRTPIPWPPKPSNRVKLSSVGQHRGDSTAHSPAVMGHCETSSSTFPAAIGAESARELTGQVQVERRNRLLDEQEVPPFFCFLFFSGVRLGGFCS